MGFFFSGVAFYQSRARLHFPLLVVAPAAGGLDRGVGVIGDTAHVVLPTFGVYLIRGVAFQTRVHVDVKGTDISYGFYLYAFPIQQMLVHAFHGRLGSLTLFALAAPLTATAAALSWHFVERPFLQGRKGRLARQAARAES